MVHGSWVTASSYSQCRQCSEVEKHKEPNIVWSTGRTRCIGLLFRWFTGSPGALVHWFTGSLVHWITGALVHWCTSALVHWFTGALVHWITGALDHWCTGSLVHRCTGSLVHWCTGSLVHWCTGSLVHWFTCALVHWFTGSLVHLAHLVHLVHWLTWCIARRKSHKMTDSRCCVVQLLRIVVVLLSQSLVSFKLLGCEETSDSHTCPDGSRMTSPFKKVKSTPRG